MMKIQSLIGRTLLPISTGNVLCRNKGPNFRLVSLRNMLRLASMLACLYLAVAVGLCEDAATLSGVVKDPTGLGIADAVVILTNQKTLDIRKSVTAATGAYSFTGLPSGDYKIQISAQGFAGMEKAIALTAGRTANIDLPLVLAVNVESVSVDAKTDPYSVVPGQPTDAVFGLNQKILGHSTLHLNRRFRTTGSVLSQVGERSGHRRARLVHGGLLRHCGKRVSPR